MLLEGGHCDCVSLICSQDVLHQIKQHWCDYYYFRVYRFIIIWSNRRRWQALIRQAVRR